MTKTPEEMKAIRQTNAAKARKVAQSMHQEMKDIKRQLGIDFGYRHLIKIIVSSEEVTCHPPIW